MPDRRDPFAGSVINVKDHGAKGNGTSDDTDELEAAIAASEEGDALYFPPGTYLVSRPLQPKADQLYFSLTDRATLKALAGETGFPMFEVRSGPVEFRQLAVDGAKDATGAPPEPVAASGIRVRLDAGAAIDVVVSGCRIENAHGDGIHITRGPDPGRGSDRVIVRDTVVGDCGGNGLGFSRVDNARVESSRIERCNNGIKMRECDDVVVHGVTASTNRRHGIVFTFSRRWHVDNCVARGNGTGTHGGWGIAAGGEPTGDQQPKPKPNRDFTITNNICEDNDRGGITLDPTVAPEEGEPEVIWPQRARVSGNVCRNAELHHGIHLTHSSDVVVTDNVCTGNKKGSGIQLVSSSHVLVQGNTCFANRNGIGLFSDKDVTNPGHHVIGINMLSRNTDADVLHQQTGAGQPLTGVRIHGLHGQRNPEGKVQAEPGTLYEWHKDDQGALFVKKDGSTADGWVRAATDNTP